MMIKIVSNNKAVSMIIATMLIFILIISVAAAQLIALETVSSSSRERISTEEQKLQEKIYLTQIINNTVGSNNYISQLIVKNSGSVIVKISGLSLITFFFLTHPTILLIRMAT